MAEETLRRKLDAAFDAGPDFPHPMLLSRTMALLDMEVVRPRPPEFARPAWLLPAVSALLAVVIVATLILSYQAMHSRSIVPVKPRPSPQAPAPTPRPQYPSTFNCAGYQPAPTTPVPVKATNASTLWATGGLLSADGGVHWQDVTPPALRQDEPANLATSQLPPGFADFYLDSNHAWLARSVSYGSATSCYDHVVVFATSDGGQTWQMSTPIPYTTGGNPLASPFPCVQGGGGLEIAPPPPSGAQCPPLHGVSLWMSFLDSRHGWLAVDNHAYGTSDGGRVWTELSSTNVRDCQFLSLTTWWCGMSRTQDGGLSWSQRQLPCACTTTPDDPVFLDPSTGLVRTGKTVTTATTETDTYGLYRTTDGGDTWHELTVPFDLYIFAMAYVDAQNLWVIADPLGWSRGAPGPFDSLYHSSDGGLHWTLVQKNTPIGYSSPGQPMKIWFVDSTHGFVIQVDQQTGAYPELLATRDGGHTWQVVRPQLS
jgi:photosystem II stability/assembly factor-like uncharacterized protein